MHFVYVVHYHEIALKGRNRPMFLRQLQENICRATGLEKGRVRIVSGRLIVIPSHSPLHKGEKIIEALSRVFGISSLSPAFLVKEDYLEIENATKTLILSSMGVLSQFNTFAIHATRGDKQFSMTSKEIEIKLGDFVRQEFGKKVDLEKPEVTFYVEIVPGSRGQSLTNKGLSSGGALVYTKRIPGPGGLPVGTQPKVAVLLSGGIDSPVAAYRIMKRGAPTLAVHFHSYPFTSRASIDKVKELVGILEQYHGGHPIPLYLVPLAEAQKAVVQHCNERYRVLLYRRLMLRIAQEIARKENALALVTGESLGQVASQTVENLSVVEAVLHCTPPLTPPPQGGETKQFPPLSPCGRSPVGGPEAFPPCPRGGEGGWEGGVGAIYSMPIFRPLIGYDKEEIIVEAKRIGTYDISIQPHDDCCSLFMPKRVATRARIIDVENEEKRIDLTPFINNALENAERQST